MSRRIKVLSLALVVGLLAAIPAAAPARAHKQRAHRYAPVPQGFIGMNAGGGIYLNGVDPSQQLDKMVASGVQSIRVTFDWSSEQPADDGQTDYTASDRIVTMAANRHLTVLPVLLNAPSWDAAKHPRFVAPPKKFGPFVSWAKLLVQRYGPQGTFWAANPSVPYEPIRRWQIWNEPNLPDYWPIHPWVRTYVKLLREASSAIKGLDPGAKIVLAGLPDYVWTYMSEIYRVRGARKAFDIVAVHPYTRQAKGVITILQRVRAVMDKHGDRRKPLLLTELGWPSSLHKSFQYYGFETTERGQATNLNEVMPLIRSERRKLGLAGFYYYTWMDNEGLPKREAPSFNFAGLFAYEHPGDIRTKPAYPVFRRWALALSDCRVKGPVANQCLKRG